MNMSQVSKCVVLGLIGGGGGGGTALFRIEIYLFHCNCVVCRLRRY